MKTKLYRLVIGLAFINFGCQTEEAYLHTVQLNKNIRNSLTNERVREVLLAPDSLKVYPHRSIYFETGNAFYTVNLRAGDVNWDRKKFRVGLIDRNDNGIYNEAGVDKLILCPYGSASTIISSSSSKFEAYLQPRTCFRVNRDIYEIFSIDESGTQIGMRKTDPREGLVESASINTFLPNVLVEDLEGKRVPLRKSRPPGEQLYILFWSLGPDRGELLLELDREYKSGSGFNIVAINMLDKKTSVVSFIEQHNVEIPCYFAVEDTCAELGCFAALPFGIWVDEQGNITEHGIRNRDFGWYRISSQ